MKINQQPQHNRYETQPVKKRVRSSDLFSRCKELIIVHNGAEYRLRLTGNDKLLLTK